MGIEVKDFLKGETIKIGDSCYIFQQDACVNEHYSEGKFDYAGWSAHVQDKKNNKDYFVKYIYIKGSSLHGIRNLEREGQFRFYYPYIEHIYDSGKAIGKNNEELYYVLAEYIEGQDLLTYRVSKKTMQGIENVMFKYMMQFLNGVQYYMKYSRKDAYIHRDLKPANILIDEKSGRAVICDFDWSHTSGSDATAARRDNHLDGGTPGYMAPNATNNDIQRDLYSIGRVFYFWLAGKHYFLADEYDKYLNAKELGYSLYDDRIPPYYLQDRFSLLIKIIRKLVASPNKAYKNIDDVIQDMKTFLIGYYGNEEIYQKIIEDKILLQSKLNRYKKNEWAVNLGVRINQGGRRWSVMENYRFHDITVDGRPVMAIYCLDNALYYMVYDSLLKPKQERIDGKIEDGDQFEYKDSVIDLKVRE